MRLDGRDTSVARVEIAANCIKGGRRVVEKN